MPVMDVTQPPALRYSFTIEAEVGEPAILEQRTAEHLEFIPINGGRVTGAVRGQVLPGGGDWCSVRCDEVFRVEARYLIRTDDDLLIRQRIAIARALAAEPQLLVADEITSALDLTTQAEILDLLTGLRTRLGLTVVFISHDLAVVGHLCDRVAVLLHGRLVEEGPVEPIFASPQHPYTARLLDSAPGSPGFTIDG